VDELNKFKKKAKPNKNWTRPTCKALHGINSLLPTSFLTGTCG
jgi:hypothetical protein